jgi:hypothetical protein
MHPLKKALAVLFVAVVFASIGTYLNVYETKGATETMNAQQKKIIDLLSLEDSAYFTLSDDDIVELQKKISASFRSGLPGAPPAPPGDIQAAEAPQILAVTAPQKVDTGKTARLPCLIATYQTGYRQWQVHYDQNTCLLVMDYQNNRLYAGPPFLKEKRIRTPEPSMSGNPPDRINALATTASVRLVDARQVAGMPDLPAHCAITAISYDWISNTCLVHAVGGEAPPKEGAKLEPSDFLLPIDTAAQKVELSEHGLGLKVQETIEKGEAIPVQGAGRIPLPEASWIPAEGGQPLFQDKSVAAVIPASLLLFRKDKAAPVTVPLHIPVFGNTPSCLNDVVGFGFSLDLRTALPNAGLSGTYQIYLLIGKVIAGPRQLSITTG